MQLDISRWNTAPTRPEQVSSLYSMSGGRVPGLHGNQEPQRTGVQAIMNRAQPVPLLEDATTMTAYCSACGAEVLADAAFVTIVDSRSRTLTRMLRPAADGRRWEPRRSGEPMPTAGAA